jgi:hypothetical protein
MRVDIFTASVFLLFQHSPLTVEPHMAQFLAMASRIATGGLGFWSLGGRLGEFYMAKAERAGL